MRNNSKSKKLATVSHSGRPAYPGIADIEIYISKLPGGKEGPSIWGLTPNLNQQAQPLLQENSEWAQIHASGHGSGDQLQRIVVESNCKKLVPIHTEHEDYYDKWHDNVVHVSLNGSIELQPGIYLGGDINEIWTVFGI